MNFIPNSSRGSEKCQSLKRRDFEGAFNALLDIRGERGDSHGVLNQSATFHFRLPFIFFLLCQKGP